MNFIGHDFNQAIGGSQMVKSQDGGLILVSGRQGSGGIFEMNHTNTMWKFICGKNLSQCNWIKINETLATARDNHVSLVVPSDFCKGKSINSP